MTTEDLFKLYPLPWGYAEPRPFSDGSTLSYVRANPGMVVVFPKSMPVEHRRALGAVIAAAPELYLAALGAEFALGEGVVGKLKLKHLFPVKLKAIRDAIAKTKWTT